MSSPTSPPATGRRAWLVLTAVCLAGGLLPASLTGTSVALPQIGADMGADLAPLQWVVNAYNLTFASFMLACGAFADLVGRRRMFSIGAALFAACSLVSALATDILVLDIARGVSGVGAAAVLTAGSAMLANTFSGKSLAKAFGILGSSFGAGLALGPSTSGLLVQEFGWESVFYVHLAVCLLVMAAIPAMRESRDPGATRVDWAGTATFTIALFLITFAMVEGPQQGWSSPAVLGMVAGFVALIIGFVVAEKVQRRPMFDLALFRQGRFVAVSLMPVALAFGFVCLLVFLPTYFIGVMDFTVGKAGLVMLILTVPVFLLPIASGYLATKIPVRVLLGISLLLVGGGAAWLTVLEPGTTVSQLVGPLLTIGAGVGISFGLLDGAAISSVAPERAGMAAGMFNTMRLASEAIAIAGMGSLLVTLTQGRISAGLGEFDANDTTAADLANRVTQGDVDAAVEAVPAGQSGEFTDLLAGSFSSAFHIVLWILAGVCVVGAPIIMALLRNRSEPAATPTPEQQPAAEPTPVA